MNEEEEIESVLQNILKIRKQSEIPINFYVKLDQPYYTPKQKLFGFLKLTVKEENYLISDIEINLTQVITILSPYNEKNKTYKETNSIFGIVIQDSSTQKKSLSQGIHLFPFKFLIPPNIKPTFLYKKGNIVLIIKSFLFFSFFDINKKKEVNFVHELFIITDNQFRIEPQLVSNSVDEQERLQIIVNVSSDSKRYSVSDFINLKVDIINKGKTAKVEYIKFSLYVKVSMRNEIITEEKILSTIIEQECLPEQSTTFYEQILFIPNYTEDNKRTIVEIKKIKESDFNIIMKNSEGYFELKKINSNEYLEGILDDEYFMDFPPSIQLKYFECVYYIKVTLYLRNKFLGVSADNRPRVFLFFKTGG